MALNLLTRPLPSFEGASAGQTATLRMPVGYTYHQILLTHGSGMTLSDMVEIRFFVNGEQVQTFRGADNLDQFFNEYEGRTASADNLLIIDFERYGIRTRDGQIVTALGTGAPSAPGADNAAGTLQVKTLTMEIDIDPNATGVSLSAKAIQSGPAELGLMKVIRRFVRNPSGAGEYEISDLPTAGNLINKVIFRVASGTGNIDRIQLYKDNFLSLDRTLAENNRRQIDGVRVPQTDSFVIDPTEDGFGSESIVTKNIDDFRWILTMDGAAELEIYVEYLAQPGAFAVRR